jgi:hypothetical protein
MSRPIPIGARLELMTDRHLIDRLENARLHLNPPERKEIVLRMERAWERRGSGVHSCVFRDGGKIKMYYRGTADVSDDENETRYCCYAESADGIRWERPELGIVEFRGSTRNNIVMAGRFARNFSPFIDTNPDCPPEQRYKAIAGNRKDGLVGYVSGDGLHWRNIREEPLMTDGAFDSHNVAFWDNLRKRYVCYSRYFARPTPDSPVFAGIRRIQSCESDDFIHWGPQRPNIYGEGVPLEHFDANAVIPCPGAEHMYLSFPMRLMPERYKIDGFPKAGVSDIVFMSSRDGVHWDREFLEAWVRPGRDRRNWTARSLIVARGIIDTTPDEFSFYICEHYEWNDACIRRLAIPRHRFASVRAGYGEGGFVTKPVIFEGSRFVINYSTSAAGSVLVQLEDEDGNPIPGFGFGDCELIFGNELDHTVVWNGVGELSALAGKPVRIRFKLKDADIYAFRFAH